MVANKHITKIIVAVMAVAVVLCFLTVLYSPKIVEAFGGTGVSMAYEEKLFNTDEIIEIDIQMDDDEWDKMLSGAMSEEYYVCDVVVNGLKVRNVAIRPKGNTSLSAIASDPETDRYSLKLEFDHFVDGQTCYGLDKLILNNNYADATNMKEALIYDMYQYLGANASLYNYAKVSLNGEYWGVYLALEAVEDSFLLRNFGTQDGELYKPDSMDMGGGDRKSSGSSDSDRGAGFDFNGKKPSSSGSGERSGRDRWRGSESSGSGSTSDGFDMSNMPGGFDMSNMPEGFDMSSMPDMGNMPGGFDMSNMPEGFDMSNIPGMGNQSASGESTSSASGDKTSSENGRGGFPGGGGGGFSMGGGGANLNYTDDELDSYSTIWAGEVTGTSKADHRRVVTALKNISEGNDLEKYLDIENILKYMAVHTFSVNSDSLSGSMAHNYYLYEYEGQLNMFPWDYNLSLGGMSMGSSGDATSLVNDAIDTPFSGTKFFNALLENEEYLERYHAYLQQLVDEYINGGKFDEFYNRVRSQIDRLVETDPTAFYWYDEYETAVETLYKVVKLRGESIDGQIKGTIPSTDSGQRNATTLIDASDINVKDMGQFNMGGNSNGFFGGRSDRFDDKKTSDEKSKDDGKTEDTSEGEKSGNVPDTGSFNPGNFDSGNMPDMGNFNPGEMPDMGSFNPGNMPDMGNFNPGEMPDMGSFNPGNKSDNGRPDTAEEGNDKDKTDNSDNTESKSGETTEIDLTDSKRSFRGSFNGSQGGNTSDNLILFGGSFVVMIVATVIAYVFKRRK